MLKRTFLSGVAVAAMMWGGIAAAQDPIQIVYIPKNTGNPYFDSLVAGFEDACKDLGCEFSQAAPARTTSGVLPSSTLSTERLA